MFDELDRAALAGDAERAGTRLRRSEGALPAHRLSPSRAACWRPRSQFEKGQADAALANLAWVADNASRGRNPHASRACALAGLLIEEKQYDEALQDAAAAARRQGSRRLVADRRGDVLLAQGKKDEARKALPGGLLGDGREGRLPPPDRSQADGTGRRPGGRRQRRCRQWGREVTLPIRWPLRALLALLGCLLDATSRKPTPLEAVTPQIAGRQVWRASIEGAASVPARARPADGEFTVAAGDGSVLALQADDGREIWRGNAGGG